MRRLSELRNRIDEGTVPITRSNCGENGQHLANGAITTNGANGNKISFNYAADRLWCKLERAAAGKHSVGSNGVPTAPRHKSAACRWLRNVRCVLEDWLLLATLGLLMAICSLGMDLAIERLQWAHVQLLHAVQDCSAAWNAPWASWARVLAPFGAWTCFPVALVTLSAFCVRRVAPQAIGSGIPEMKTILRGVILKEYLTPRTLVSKMIGLTLALGSGMPIGKEGPFVHIASVMANLLSQCVRALHFAPPFGNESRSYEMLAAACAVGVSSTFSAPVGGVLFSIEVTSAYFAIRNYWRGFFAATCSATLLRLLRVLTVQTEVTVTAFYQTNFPTMDAFFPEELPLFALIGILCGFLAAAFIALQRQLVLFLRHNRLAKLSFQKYWVLYPTLVAFIVGSLTYPAGFGRFIGGEERFSQTAKDFFNNCTWSLPHNSSAMACPKPLLRTWTGPQGEYGHYCTLACFAVTYFFLSALTSTVPIPCGIFGPSFVFGAAVGRMAGELVADLFPQGIKGLGYSPIFPGVYAVVGAAAFCGGVTHTVSVAVIVFELTGQLMYILPVMIAVLAANAVSSYLQPSIYDSAIRIKRLPYLPDIAHNSSQFHGIRVAQFMTREVHCLHNATTCGELRALLARHPRLKAFPLVSERDSRILIGSCSRARLLRALHARIGVHARQREAQRRRVQRMTECATAEIRQDQQETARVGEHAVAARVPESMPNRFTVQKSAMDLPVACSNSCNDTTARMKRSLTIPATLADADACSSFSSQQQTTLDVYATLGGMIRTLSRWSSRLRKSAGGADSEEQIGEMQDGDLHGEERVEWERTQLARRVNFSAIGIDPAPFQLVAHTSLVKVHSLFSLLGLRRAYVTNCGQLIGVVALRDLRLAIERANAGDLVAEEEEETEAAELEEAEADPAATATMTTMMAPEGDEHPSEPDDDAEEDVDEEEEEKRSTSADEDDDKDILSPRLAVVSRAESSVHARGDSVRSRTRTTSASGGGVTRAHVRTASAALRQLARGMLGTAQVGDSATVGSVAPQQDRKESTKDADDEEQREILTPPAIFVISSEDDDDEETKKGMIP